MRYDRKKAVEYARKWALDRNPKYYNYDNLGGDCTNFISQCLYAGIPEMNYRKYGWYYIDANKKSPSWTGVIFLYEFLINNKYEGPKGIKVNKNEVEKGDIIQLSFIKNIFGHTLFITNVDSSDIQICTHTLDSKNRYLSSYVFEEARFIKILDF